MLKLKQLGLLCSVSIAMSAIAADFEFDRPGTGFSTGITPVGQLAWEQGLPSAEYVERNINGNKSRVLQLNADMLLRTGLGKNTELQLGWDGPAWTESRFRGNKIEDDGLGDISVGVKHHIDLNDDKLKMAVLAQATLATGNNGFSNDEDIYTVASTVNYQYSDLVITGISMFYSVQDEDWSVTAVPTIGYKIAGNLSGYSELVYTKKESIDNQYALGTGLIYNINNRTQLDTYMGIDLEGSDRSYNGGFGVSVLF